MRRKQSAASIGRPCGDGLATFSSDSCIYFNDNSRKPVEMEQTGKIPMPNWDNSVGNTNVLSSTTPSIVWPPIGIFKRMGCLLPHLLSSDFVYSPWNLSGLVVRAFVFSTSCGFR